MNIKSIMAIGAVALSATVFGEISSANIVGYQGSNIKGGLYYMLTASFDSTKGDGTGIAVKDLVTGDIPYGTEMQVRRPEGDYDIYTYIDEAFDAEATDPALEFVPGWADGVGDLATVKVTPGQTFWLKSETDCRVTIAGAILSDVSKTVTVNAGIFSMIGNAYPVDVNPNSIAWTGLTVNDELQVRLDAGDYDVYKYTDEAFDASATDPALEFVPGWADGLGDLVSTSILKAGRGAWIKPAEQVSVTWVSPIE